MRALLQSAALLLTVLGLGCGLLTLARLHHVAQALAVLLDFLLAAGLLRLAAHPGYRDLATAAVVIGIRKVVVAGMGSGPRTPRDAGDRPRRGGLTVGGRPRWRRGRRER